MAIELRVGASLVNVKIMRPAAPAAHRTPGGGFRRRGGNRLGQAEPLGETLMSRRRHLAHGRAGLVVADEQGDAFGPDDRAIAE